MNVESQSIGVRAWQHAMVRSFEVDRLLGWHQQRRYRRAWVLRGAFALSCGGLLPLGLS